MTQSLLTIVVFIGLICAVPFVLRRLQQRRGLGPAGAGGSACLLYTSPSPRD